MNPASPREPQSLRLLAPAKINLHLRVGPPTPDGFHPLLSWMCTVALFDTIVLSRGTGQPSRVAELPNASALVELSCDDPSVPCDASNLIAKTASALADAIAGDERGKEQQLVAGEAGRNVSPPSAPASPPATREGRDADVGASVGQYARMLRRAGYTGRIVSFEPLPHLVERLRRASRDDPDWIVMDCGLGDEDTKAEINVVRGTMSSMLEPSEFGEGWSRTLRDRGDRTETVNIRRLDGVLDEAVAGLDQPRVYLKMDTQGFDLQAFSGAGDRVGEILGLQSELACVPIYDGCRGCRSS